MPGTKKEQEQTGSGTSESSLKSSVTVEEEACRGSLVSYAMTLHLHRSKVSSVVGCPPHSEICRPPHPREPTPHRSNVLVWYLDHSTLLTSLSGFFERWASVTQISFEFTIYLRRNDRTLCLHFLNARTVGIIVSYHLQSGLIFKLYLDSASVI